MLYQLSKNNYKSLFLNVVLGLQDGVKQSKSLGFAVCKAGLTAVNQTKHHGICLTYAVVVLYFWYSTKEVKPVAIASLFKNGRNQAIRLPKELEFEGVSEVEIRREGNSIIITPLRQTWLSFANTPAADTEFLKERENIIQDGRVNFDD